MTAKTKKAERKKRTTKVRYVAADDKEDEPSPKKNGPQNDWSDTTLKKYGLDRLDEAARHEGSALLALVLAGEAFAIVRDRLKPKHQWTGWLKGLGVRRQRAWKAIKVYEGAAAEAAGRELTVEEVLAGKTYTQAMEAWARAEPQARGEEDRPTPGQEPREDRKPGDRPGTRDEGGPALQPRHPEERKPDGQAVPGGEAGQEAEDGDEPVAANGNIRFARGKATVTAEVLRQVSSVDRSRQVLVARNWDARTKAALTRQVAVLLVPELDDRCLPAAKGGAA